MLGPKAYEYLRWSTIRGFDWSMCREEAHIWLNLNNHYAGRFSGELQDARWNFHTREAYVQTLVDIVDVLYSQEESDLEPVDKLLREYCELKLNTLPRQ